MLAFSSGGIIGKFILVTITGFENQPNDPIKQIEGSTVAKISTTDYSPGMTVFYSIIQAIALTIWTTLSSPTLEAMSGISFVLGLSTTPVLVGLMHRTTFRFSTTKEVVLILCFFHILSINTKKRKEKLEFPPFHNQCDVAPHRLHRVPHHAPVRGPVLRRPHLLFEFHPIRLPPLPGARCLNGEVKSCSQGYSLVGKSTCVMDQVFWSKIAFARDEITRMLSERGGMKAGLVREALGRQYDVVVAEHALESAVDLNVVTVREGLVELVRKPSAARAVVEELTESRAVGLVMIVVGVVLLVWVRRRYFSWMAARHAAVVGPVLGRVNVLPPVLVHEPRPMAINIRGGFEAGNVQDERVKLCSICAENEMNVALRCGHIFCSVCASRMRETSGTCAICRDRIHVEPMRVYM